MKQETKQVNFRLPVPLVEELQEIASKTERTLTSLTISAIKAKINEVKRRESAKQEREVVPV